MGIDRFRTLLALPLASVFLILLVYVFAKPLQHSVGVRMPLLRLKPPGQEFTCDGRWVFVELLKDGKAEVNLEPVSDEDLPALVGGLMQSHAERVVFLVPSSDIPYSRFVETFRALQLSAPNTHVGVLSGTLRDQYVGPPITSPLQRTYLPCDIVWPAKEFQTIE